jgi:hypothetical protein
MEGVEGVVPVGDAAPEVVGEGPEEWVWSVVWPW